MPTHLGQAVVLHLSKQAGRCEEQVKMLKAENERLSIKCDTLEESHKELEKKMNEMFHAFKTLANKEDIPTESKPGRGEIEHSTDAVLTNSPQKLKTDIIADDGEYINADQMPEPQDYSYASPLKLERTKSSPLPKTEPSSLANLMTMSNFEQHKMNNDHWVSQPFFTHAQGYKMCLRVTANGQGSGQGYTHLRGNLSNEGRV